MSSERPPELGDESTSRHPRSGQASHANSAPPAPSSSSRMWPAIVLSAVASILAIAALAVSLTRSPSPAAATAAHSFSGAETATAQRQLCDTYKLAARAVEVDTGGSDRALARVATTNGAVMLDNAVANPALNAKYREAARALAGAYGTLTAMSSNAVATDAQYQAALDDITAKDAVMKSMCADGGS